MARSIETTSVHAGEPRDKAHDSLVTPTHPPPPPTPSPTPTSCTATSAASSMCAASEYGRYGNPTQEVAEAKLAALDGGGAALLTSTGMSALVTTLLAMIRPGMHLVITADSYRKTRVFVREFLAKFGIEHTSCEPSVEGIAAALKPNTRLIITESPTNPYLNWAPTSVALVALCARQAGQDPDRRYPRHPLQPPAAGLRHRPGGAQRDQVPGRPQ